MPIPDNLFILDRSSPLHSYKNNWIKKKLYRMTFSKLERKKIQQELYLMDSIQIAESWRYLIDLYFQQKLPITSTDTKRSLSSSKVIWQYWGQGINKESLPEIVKLCFNSIDRFKDNYTVIRLDDSSVKEYLDIPEYIWQKKASKSISPAFFSDILRLALLYHYGGIWIDSTMLLTDKIPKTLRSEDLFMFQRNPEAQNKDIWENFNHTYFRWDSRHKINVLNSFIIAKQNNYSIKVLLDLLLIYWKFQDNSDFYLFFQVLFDELTKHELKNKNGILVDDTLPHLLQLNLDSPFSQEHLNNIKKHCFIHKLSHHKKTIEKCSLHEHLLTTDYLS